MLIDARSDQGYRKTHFPHLDRSRAGPRFSLNVQPHRSRVAHRPLSIRLSSHRSRTVATSLSLGNKVYRHSVGPRDRFIRLEPERAHYVTLRATFCFV